jgi:hypothetical protein
MHVSSMSPDSLMAAGERLCAGALRFSQPKGPLPLLIINLARNYAGSNFSDSIGEFIDLAPITWRDGESFVDMRKRVMSYMRDHRVNICALMENDSLRLRFPRASQLLNESICLEDLAIQCVNLLILYGTQTISPDLSQSESMNESKSVNESGSIGEPIGEHKNKHAVLNIQVRGDSIVIDNVRCRPGQEEQLKAYLMSLI